MIWALLLFGVQQSAPLRDLLDPQLAVERVSRCGLGRPKVRYDKDLQMEVLELRGPTRASDEQLACVDKASGYLEVEFSLALRSRFYAISVARYAAEFKVRGRRWLADHGLLERLPIFRPGGDDAAFARSLEQLCGPGAAGALDPLDNGHSFSAEWLARQKPNQPNDASTCLFYAAAAADFPLGFVGNEVDRR